MNHQARKQITLRGLPEKVFEEIKMQARRQKKSMNEILLNRLSPDTSKRSEGACADILSLAGTWTPSQTKDFEKQMKDHRKVDEELWS